MEILEVIKFFLVCMFIFVFSYIQYYNDQRLKGIKSTAENALTPDNITMTAFRTDLNSIMNYVASLDDGTLVLKAGYPPVEKMRITRDGKVGIGTATVYGKITIMDANGGIVFEGPSVTSYNKIKSFGAEVSVGRDLIISTTNTGENTLYISNSNKVGINMGTATPNYTLDVNGAVRLYNSSTPPTAPTSGGVLYVDNGVLKFSTSAGVKTVTLV